VAAVQDLSDTNSIDRRLLVFFQIPLPVKEQHVSIGFFLNLRQLKRCSPTFPFQI
jgi:hypothetical protein